MIKFINFLFVEWIVFSFCFIFLFFVLGRVSSVLLREVIGVREFIILCVSMWVRCIYEFIFCLFNFWLILFKVIMWSFLFLIWMLDICKVRCIVFCFVLNWICSLLFGIVFFKVVISLFEMWESCLIWVRIFSFNRFMVFLFFW